MEGRLPDIFGEKPAIYKSGIEDELDKVGLESEIYKISTEIEKGSPLIVTVSTAQIARELLQRYTPGAVISDNEFYLNGERTRKWMFEHGMENYPLIGLSGITFNELLEGDIGPERLLYGENGERYFFKEDIWNCLPQFIEAIKNSIETVRNNEYTITQ